MKFTFPVSNNKAEYEAFLVRLHMVRSLKITHILVNSDSRVVIGQVKGEFHAKEDNMQKHL